MAPSTLSNAAALLLLSLSVASAAATCTLKSSSGSSDVCGTLGKITSSDYYLVDLYDAASTTPEGCAAACAATDSCLSFDLDPGVFCELSSGTQSQLGFTSTSDLWFQGYDQSCFTCVDSTSSTSSAVSSTSSAASSSSSSSSTETSDISSSLPTETPNSSLVPVSTGSVSISVSLPTSTQPAGNSTSTSAVSSFPTSKKAYYNSTIAISSTVSITPSGYPVGSISSSSVVSTVQTSAPVSSYSAPAVPSASVPYVTGSASASVSKSSEVLKTSTVYATSVYTITSCAPSVTDCPVGSVTTRTVALYTTICPVTATQTSETSASAPAPTSVESQNPSSSVEIETPLTTSTVYTTSVYTVTSCAASVTDCPLGSVSTKTVVLYTTICPVTATHTENPVPPASSVQPVPHGSAPVAYSFVTVVPVPEDTTTYETSSSTAVVYHTASYSSPSEYPEVPVRTVGIPAYPTAPAVVPSRYTNGTASSTSSALGAVGTASSLVHVSVTGYPTNSPTLISVNSANGLGVKGWGMGVVGLIGAALML